MSYKNFYAEADKIIEHLNEVVPNIKDDFISSRYAGFVSVVGVTAYEKAVKEIFYNFAQKKHRLLGNLTKAMFSKINGRIKYEYLKEYAAQFGDKYLKKFKQRIQVKEKQILIGEKTSMLQNYANIIFWRHKFVHEGVMPEEPTYHESVKAFRLGKEIVDCLNEAMQR